MNGSFLIFAFFTFLIAFRFLATRKEVERARDAQSAVGSRPSGQHPRPLSTPMWSAEFEEVLDHHLRRRV